MLVAMTNLLVAAVFRSIGLDTALVLAVSSFREAIVTTAPWLAFTEWFAAAVA